MTNRYRFALIGFGLLLSVVAAAISPARPLAGWGSTDDEPNLADLAHGGPPRPEASTLVWDGPKASQAAERPAERVRGSFIVELAPGLDPHEVGPQLAAQYGGEAEFIYDEVIGGFAFRGPDEARDALARDPRVSGVEEDNVVYPMSHRPELVSMGAVDAWNVEPTNPAYRGSGAVVAVLDTALQVKNPYLGDGDTVLGEPGDSILGVHSCAGGSAITDSSDHGTWVMGTAVGREGVLPLGKGYHVKIGSDTASESAMVCGLNKVKSWIGEGKTIHAVNVSWGCDCSLSSARSAIASLRAIGVPVAVSAGNSGKSVHAPARYPESVAVSALDRTNTYLASFSSRGPEIDIGAPGEKITVLYGVSCCATANGTSFAAPHTAAAAALVKSFNPSATVDDVVRALQERGFTRPGLIERALNVAGAARGTDRPASVSFLGVSDGQEVSGTVTLRVSATDDNPLPPDAVSIKIGEAAATNAPLVGSAYERTWDTCPTSPCPADPPAPVTIQASVRDSVGQLTTTSIGLVVDNIDGPPTVSFVRPISGAQLSRSFDVRVAATDDNALSGVELFLDGVSQGVRSTPASGNEYAWSLANVALGSRTLRAVARDGTSESASSITVEVREVFYRQGFDGAAGDPNDIAGWTVSGSTPLWHLSSSCGAASSAPRGFYYGQDSSCNYDRGGTYGYLASPTISGLPSTYTLSFSSKEKVESGCEGGSCSTRDVRSVEVDYGQGWQQIYKASAATDTGSGSWLKRSFALGSASGSLRIRFLFNTGSGANNAFFGWAIDDIVIAP